MGKTDIEAKSYLLNKFFVVIISIGIIYAINYKLSDKLFKWEKFNPNGIITLFFIGITILCAFSIINLFDDGPKIKIDKKGFFVRKSFLPFSSLKLLDWAEIEFITLESEKQKNMTSTFLTIKIKSKIKSIRIDLDSLDQTEEEILSVIRNYTTIINFKDRSKIR